jgi:hypothetical protein
MTNDINLSDLNLIDDNEAVIDLDNLPEERSSVPKFIPTPGETLLLQLPTISKENLAEIVKPLDTPKGQRIQLLFKGANALRVGGANGTQLEVTVSGKDKTFFKEGSKEPAGITNDIARLVKAAGYQGTIASKKDTVDGVLASSGKLVTAFNDAGVSCNPLKPIWRDSQEQAGTMGCGARYGLKAKPASKDGKYGATMTIPRNAQGTFETKFTCRCGAGLTAWSRLTNFKPAK